MKKQRGYSLIELTIVIVILFILSNIILSYASDFIHRYKIDSSAADLSLVPIAVQRRNAHDGFLFSFWDENGNRAPTGNTITWAEGAEFVTLLNNFLVGRNNTQCGQGAAGWNPVDTDGRPDGTPPVGVQTLIESAALVPCLKLRNRLPWGLTASAAISPDTTPAVGSFAMYLNFSNAYFESKDNPGNNILNAALLRNALESKLKDGVNGVPRVNFTIINDLDDITDDGIDDGAGGFRPMTSRECEERLNECVIGVYIDFAGTTNGMFKRTDNQDFFVDDITFGASVAGGRQKCAFWTENTATNTWTSVETDCGIKGGSGDTEVTVVVDNGQFKDLRITPNAAGVGVDHLCQIYIADPANNLTLRPSPSPTAVTPCGFTNDGNIVQLMSKEMHTGTLYGEDVIATSIFSSQISLFSDSNGAVVFRVSNTAGQEVFRLDNNGNFEASGSGTIEGDLNVFRNGRFLMQDNSTIQLGLVTDASSLTLSRGAGGTFTLSSTGNDLEILAERELSLGAPEGVILENGTTIHASRSTLTGELFDPINGTSGNNALKARSELVTADMAKYLDDTSSPIQIVGIDRIEGEFATLVKPNCLAFAQDSLYGNNEERNPYQNVLTDDQRNNPVTGQSYARLVLVPIFMKTYNAAFGDNQIYSQHGVHSSPSEWDIYLYLSGEGAFGTGGREDGAGASLAMSICDYSGLNLSRQNF